MAIADAVMFLATSTIPFLAGLLLILSARLLVTTAAEKIPATGWWGVGAVLLTMGLILGYVWYTSHLFVDNGVKSAGSMAFWFELLALAMFCVAAGLKALGGIPANAFMKLIRFIWPLPPGAESLTTGIWTSLVFVIMGIAFFIYYLHFLSY